LKLKILLIVYKIYIMKWLWTALVTPFKKGNWVNNEIDFDALDVLLDQQIEWNVDGVLLLWTTAESPTLTSEEWDKIVEKAIEKLRWKTKIMVNVWNYSTQDSLDNIEKFDKVEWIDAYLVVNPYYSKPTQTWLFKHFTTIAKSTSQKIFLYNIFWRTGVNLETSTLVDIVNKCPNVIWVKEASWNLEQVKDVISKTSSDFIILSWEEALTYDLIKHWGHWVVSVASNCKPKMMKDFVDTCFNNIEEAEKINTFNNNFFNNLFLQTNPLPAKTYLASKWFIEEEFRLPLCKMDEDKREYFLNFIVKNNY